MSYPISLIQDTKKYSERQKGEVAAAAKSSEQEGLDRLSLSGPVRREVFEQLRDELKVAKEELKRKDSEIKRKDS